MWNTGDKIISEAEPYLPPLNVAPPVQHYETIQWPKAMKDIISKGIINELGLGVSPPFRHHIDDHLYANKRKYFIRALSASLLSLYRILGVPDGRQPNTFSFEKMITSFTHMRKYTGEMMDLRKLIVYPPQY